ncbi:hypothetical protein AK812_SmicGene46851, partial [Symbiodinium microadriaticum]
ALVSGILNLPYEWALMLQQPTGDGGPDAGSR